MDGELFILVKKLFLWANSTDFLLAVLIIALF